MRRSIVSPSSYHHIIRRPFRPSKDHNKSNKLIQFTRYCSFNSKLTGDRDPQLLFANKRPLTAAFSDEGKRRQLSSQAIKNSQWVDHQLTPLGCCDQTHLRGDRSRRLMSTTSQKDPVIVRHLFGFTSSPTVSRKRSSLRKVPP